MLQQNIWHIGLVISCSSAWFLKLESAKSLEGGCENGSDI